MVSQNMITALNWASKGISPIPVLEKSKVPQVEWRIWQDRIPPKKTIEYWFRDDKNNIGVICGGRSNLAIIDFDDIDSYRDWRHDMLQRNDTWRDVSIKTYRVRTARGMHVYLTTDRPEISRKMKAESIDIRCSGNYTLVPPSIHPSGVKYEAIGSPDNIMHVNSLSEIFPEPKILVHHEDKPFDIFDAGSNELNIKELKDRIPILSFVSQFSMVRRTSVDGRWWMARCIHPSHNDHHPSFQIDTRYNRAKCRSSKCPLCSDMGLDVIDLYSRMNNLSVGETIRELKLFYI